MCDSTKHMTTDIPSTLDAEFTSTLRHLTSRQPCAIELKQHSTLPCRACGGHLLFLGERECVVQASLGRLCEVRLQIDIFCLDCFERRGTLDLVFGNLVEWHRHAFGHLDHADHRPAADVLDVTILETAENVVRCCLTWVAGCSCGAWLGGGELCTTIDIRELVLA